MNFVAKGLAVLSVAALSASNASAALIGHWQFEGDAVNSGTLGANHDGTLFGGVTFVDGPTGFGQAVNFDGTTGYILVNNSNTLGPLDLVDTAYTIAAWAKAAEGATVGRIIQKDDGANNSGGYQVFFDQHISHNNGVSLNRPVGPLPTDGGWHHYAVRYDIDAQTLEVFVDGVKTHGFSNVSALLSDGDDWLRFGAGAFDVLQGQFSFQGFAGALDDVRIYDEAISDARIAQLAAIPEPASLVLMGMGAAMMLRRKR